MEDLPSSSPTPADFTDESDRNETEEEKDHDNVFGVRLYLFEPITEPVLLVKERCRFIPAMELTRQWQACVSFIRQS